MLKTITLNNINYKINFATLPKNAKLLNNNATYESTEMQTLEGEVYTADIITFYVTSKLGKFTVNGLVDETTNTIKVKGYSS